jgi:cellulose synthase/poly-beta-1,6-N-acetylglucosamine synthase-like glycosyltransferase
MKNTLEQIGLSLLEISKKNHSRPEQYWNINKNYLSSFNEKTLLGKKIAKSKKVNILCLARNCEKNLLNSIDLISETRSFFCESSVLIYENDSTDDTKKLLKKYDNEYNIVSLDDNEPYLVGMENRRTTNLAKYRNYCLDWVKKHNRNHDYTIVLDLDADGGFSIDGILNSIFWLNNLPQAGGIGSYSLCIELNQGKLNIAHYDSFAARLNCWENMGNEWFSCLYLLTGSDPFLMNSCFGGLGIYKTESYLSGFYEGWDCEHVTFHKNLCKNNWKIYLNPGSRFGSVIKIDDYNLLSLYKNK